MPENERVAEILVDWYDRQDRGEAVDPEELIRDHPEIEIELREAFGALEYVDVGLGNETGSFPALPERIAEYRIERVLGMGGMGTVFLGIKGEQEFALKVIHPHLLAAPGFFKRFLREAEIGTRVDHPNVVRTLDVDATVDDGRHFHFLVMEYVKGQTLSSLIHELGTSPEALCRHIGLEVAKALEAIHEAGVIHRDLKPENVLITEEQRIKVMDLGVARLADEARRLSQTGVFVGSVLYAAPEQLNGEDVDARADLYALGLLLYELATGQHPFRSDDVAAVMRKQASESPRPAAEINPQLSPYFEEVVRTLLHKDRGERPASAGVLRRILEDGETGAWWQGRARAIRAATRKPLRRIRIPRETGLWGREKDLSRLRACFDAARAGQGQVLLIEGEAGIGKTRLVDEFVAQLRADGEDLNFLFGSYPPTGASAVAGGLPAAFRAQFDADGSGPYLPQTSRLVASFDAALRGAPAPENAIELD